MIKFFCRILAILILGISTYCWLGHPVADPTTYLEDDDATNSNSNQLQLLLAAIAAATPGDLFYPTSPVDFTTAGCQGILPFVSVPTYSGIIASCEISPPLPEASSCGSHGEITSDCVISGELDASCGWENGDDTYVVTGTGPYGGNTSTTWRIISPGC